MSRMEELATAIMEGDAGGIKELVQKAIDEGIQPEDVLSQGLMQGMEVVGKRFANEEMFIPEVMLCARTMHSALEIIRPLLESQEKKMQMKGKLLLGTVAGDIHDIGKSLVEMMFTANGFDVIDLGVDVAAEDFIAAVDKHEPDFLGISALLTTTMPKMPEIIQLLDKQGIRKSGCRCRILVGGAPLSKEFAEEIGADCYADNAIEAVSIARNMLGSAS